MKITKLGHCCLLVETHGLRILTDPGNFSVLQDEEKNIDVILITHEHSDHFHVDSLKCVLKNNPQAKIYTNSAVGKLLKAEHIQYEILDNGHAIHVGVCSISAHGQKHARIYQTFGEVENTGYFIADTFFYPGDALTNPGKPVEILALPVAGPWIKTSEAIEYALGIKPKYAFPVHDGALKILGGFHAVPAKILGESGIDFKIIKEGESVIF